MRELKREFKRAQERARESSRECARKRNRARESSNREFRRELNGYLRESERECSLFHVLTKRHYERVRAPVRVREICFRSLCSTSSSSLHSTHIHTHTPADWTQTTENSSCCVVLHLHLHCRHQATRAFVVSFVCTFFPMLNVPVFWPILLIYFVVLFTVTMKKQILHMIKHKYIPLSLGKPTYKSPEK
jgi:Rer1 family